VDIHSHAVTSQTSVIFTNTWIHNTNTEKKDLHNIINSFPPV
jgi:hypothetical protein